MTKSVSDFVAASMDAVLKSSEHKTLFGYKKFASDTNCAEDHEHDKESCGDSMMADDNDAKKKGKMPPWLKDKKDESSSSDSSSADDADLSFEAMYPDAAEYISAKFPSAAKELGLHTKEDLDERFPVTSNLLDEMGMSAAAGFDIAIDSLLTASAALDGVGMEKTAALSLKLASLVVEAKKKDKSSSGKSSSDSNAAKDKAAKEKAKAKEKAEKEKAKEKAAKEKEKKDALAAKDKLAKEKAKEKEKAAKEKAAKEKASKK